MTNNQTKNDPRMGAHFTPEAQRQRLFAAPLAKLQSGLTAVGGGLIPDAEVAHRGLECVYGIRAVLQIERVEVFGVAMPLSGTFTSAGVSKQATKC